MPGKIKVKVLAGRNLPVMDRASDTTDAFVEIKFGGVTHKTDVCRKSLNPHWNNTEWYRFEVDESELQDEPLQLRLMDHDTYSANDAIGKVVISLAPLLAREANNPKSTTAPHGGAVLSGWIPVFDTMHGIRGELNVIVKVELFSDFNKYKTSSCGVQFFHCPMIPPGYRANSIHGFVEELVVNDDPEYQWIDKIRTPRASNEARQVAFIKLSNQVQRLVGLKAAELGANAVVGYQQDFDLEGEAGVVARAVGTAVSITPIPTPSYPNNIPPCTQQQLKKYVDILATDRDDVTDLNEYFQTHQDELQKLVNILNPKAPSLLDDQIDDDDDKSFELNRKSSVKSYTGNISLYQDQYVSQKSLKHITEDQTDLNRLLNKRDDYDSDSSGPIKKIKKLKTNFFSKRFSVRSRKSEKDADLISLKSNSSDNSRISILDIKNEIKKLKRLKKPKLPKPTANKEEEGEGMASILARSVIHANTSLACIAETHDSEHSPCSTLRRTSESEPTLNLSDDDKTRATSADRNETEETKKVPEIHFTSLTNITSEEIEPTRVRKISESCPTSPVAERTENLLKLPGDPEYFDSVSSALSGESSDIYSSSDEDDESSDLKTDNERSIETTSSVVRSVLNHEVNPAIIAQMGRKLSILENETSDGEEKRNQDLSMKSISLESVPFEMKSEVKVPIKHEASTSARDLNTSVMKPNTHYIKLHNPFAHKKASKSISAPSSPTEKNSFVNRSSKKIKRQLSKISKSSMIKSLSHYSLLPKKKDEKVTLSHPGSSSNITSKVSTGDTVLGSPFLSYSDLMSLDKVSIATQKAMCKSDDFDPKKVSMYIGSEPESRCSFSGPSSPQHRDDLDHPNINKKEKASLKPTGLLHTAMETILIDRVHSLLIPTSPDPVNSKAKQFFNDVSLKLEQVESSRSLKESNGHLSVPPKTNKAQSLPPESPVYNSVKTKPFLDDFRHSKAKSSESKGLIHTAMETILLDKAQSIIGPVTPEPKTSIHFPNFNKKEKSKPKHCTGLVQTAMQTMLLDTVQSVLLETPEPSPTSLTFEIKDKYDNTETDSNTRDSTGLVHTALETILLDQVQNICAPIEIATNEGSKINQIHNKDAAMSVCETAILKAASDKTDQPKNVLTDEPEKKLEELQSPGLVQMAMETILIDKVQSLLDPNNGAPSKSTDPVKNPNEFTTTHTFAATSTNESNATEKNETEINKENEDSKIEKQVNKPEYEQEVNQDFKSTNTKKLTRQESIHSVTESLKMSNENIANVPHKITKPMLQNFHPILSGVPLETIPSLPESSLDRAESLDVEGVENNDSVGVCGNSHAVCGVGRSERDRDRCDKDKGSPRHARHESYGGRDPPNPPAPAPALQNPSLNATSTPMGIHRRSSDSDLSVTPKGGSLNTSAGNVGSGGGAILRPSMNSNNLDMLEYPFLTMTEFPPGFIVHIGGTVCARSVKLAEGGGEGAWAELRTELRAHARALRCNAVIAYSDSAAICEDVCVLSASGTAAVINLDCDYNVECEQTPAQSGPKGGAEADACSAAHVPYAPGSGPYRAELSLCAQCRRARVPSVLLATCAKPSTMPTHGKAVTLTAVAARVRRAPPTAEPGARDISDQLPFLEYELHKLLLAKLRMQGANALFSLCTRVAVGERCVVALASGAAYRLRALPPPAPPALKASESDRDATEIQRALRDAFNANKAANGYDVAGVSDMSGGGALAEAEGEEPPALDLCADKDACVLELDEAEDVETAKSLCVRRGHMRVYSRPPPARAPPLAFAQVWRARLTLSGQGGAASQAAERHVARALDGVTYKLRRLNPCALAIPKFQLELPEDEIQLVVSGTAIPLPEPGAAPRDQRDDDIFALDEEQLLRNGPAHDDDRNLVGQIPTTVSLTTLSDVSGSRAVRRICAIRLLFVRETTTVREMGGLSGFLHTFTCEVLAIARAHTAALGGNALTSFYLTQLMLQDNAHKNQGQCLLSVGGDVVQITY
ncbi:uncharacterized protein LOC114249729 isoform X2 [Bombyx mandarina]|uniref:Uncharacterized protein LOC114249729 isoform X2 n=1 Tax=Bombyx mandarina TaxID=7092 RepID=A0A6J2KC19_BOMMA|nr:uncharacterized protein LOC114249729 isoform X2 [Bombyx mandarina]